MVRGETVLVKTFIVLYKFYVFYTLLHCSTTILFRNVVVIFYVSHIRVRLLIPSIWFLVHTWAPLFTVVIYCKSYITGFCNLYDRLASIYNLHHIITKPNNLSFYFTSFSGLATRSPKGSDSAFMSNVFLSIMPI